MKIHTLTELRSMTVPQLQSLLKNTAQVLADTAKPVKPVVVKVATPKTTAKPKATKTKATKKKA